MRSGIYRIVQKGTRRQYIGSAANLAGRWSVHRHHLERGTHHNSRLQRAWIKHGAESFAFEVLEFVEDKALLVQAEQAHIDARIAAGDDLFNHCLTAGSTLGRSFSNETLARMSATRKGRTHTEEAKKRMSEARRGKPKSPEHRRKIGEAQIGKVIPAEQRMKLSVKAREVQKDRTRDGNGRYVGAEVGVVWSEPQQRRAA